MACVGCGGQVTTGGCINPTCGYSMGGIYVNGVKVRTASGRSLVSDPITKQLRERIAAMTDDELAALWDRLQKL